MAFLCFLIRFTSITFFSLCLIDVFSEPSHLGDYSHLFNSSRTVPLAIVPAAAPTGLITFCVACLNINIYTFNQNQVGQQ